MGFCPQGQTEVSTFLKYFLMFGTFLHWVAALAMIGLGAWSYQERNKYFYQEITTIYEFFLDLSIALMFFGSFMFLITFCGFVGALRENTLLLRIFYKAQAVIFLLEVIGVCVVIGLQTKAKEWASGLFKKFYISLAVIFLLEVIGVCVVIGLQTKAKEWASGLFKKVYIDNYQDDEEQVADYFQEKFKCCGVDGYLDWNANMYFNCTDENLSALRCSVPYSCCKVLDPYQSGLTNIFCGKGAIEEDADLTNIYTLGCLDAFENWIQDNLPIVGGIAAAILTPQLLGIILGRCFVGQIENQLDRNALAARRRWNRRGIL